MELVRLIAFSVAAGLTAMACMPIYRGYDFNTKSKYTGKQEVVYMEDVLRNQVAFQLSCPATDLAVTALGSIDTAGVEGCGYRLVCKYTRSGWVANTSSPSLEYQTPPRPQDLPALRPSGAAENSPIDTEPQRDRAYRP